ncbi:hypothetical protein Pint_20737 [Pistacia integerrima]|uniref:Uncharacterized protein n=1 Tax=Pistacia integerrima TaxID=434235 RepID=A0ACC0X952_9ROSI|nr:hypothetical protein Pint_20737 [Pistacia integerrima]
MSVVGVRHVSLARPSLKVVTTSSISNANQVLRGGITSRERKVPFLIPGWYESLGMEQRLTVRKGGEEVVSDTAANVVEEIDRVLEISLHAICGAKAPKTMRVIGRWGHDFANLIMKYEVVGKEVELKGVTARMDTVISDPTRDAR